MDEMKQLSENVVQLARLALAGRPQDIQVYIRRLAKQMRESFPEAAAGLSELLEQAPTRQSPLRNETMPAVPVDLDSRLQLLRNEFPVLLDVEPIWGDEVKQHLEQVVGERLRGD